MESETWLRRKLPTETLPSVSTASAISGDGLKERGVNYLSTINYA